MRGTKRVCQACEVRFYDLLREPIVCPSCGAHYVPAQQTVEVGARAAPFTNKTGWRSRGFKRPDPERDADAAPEAVATDDATEETLSPVPNEDVVLDEQEPDEADVSAFVDPRVAEPKER